MFFALSRFEIFIPEGRSLKAKRSVVNRIKERVRGRFRAAICEVGTQDLHQRGTLGVALVGLRPSALAEGLAAIRRLIEEDARCQIVSWEPCIHAFSDVAGDHPGDWDGETEGDRFYGPLWERRADRGESQGPIEGD
ncbi:MAG: DUF503 domain-containing protein [Candidatus Eisenbacteria sp.]|nr:DUF503 domain-containing protein [Candidatus Eisenbacteria bacterium]